MTSQMPPDGWNAMLELFLSELKTQTDQFQVELDSILEGASIQSVFENLFRLSHTIKGAAKIVQLDAIIEIAQTLESFFSSYTEERSEKFRHNLSVFSELLTLLKKIVEYPPNILFEQLKVHTAEFNRIILNIKDLLTEKAVTDQLFNKEIKNQEYTYKQAVTAFSEDPSDRESMKNLLGSIRVLKESARANNLEPIRTFLSTIENALEALYKENVKWGREEWVKFFSVMDVLTTLFNTADIQVWLEQYSDDLPKLCDIITLLIGMPSTRKVEDIMESSLESQFQVDRAMLELFITELESQVKVLSDGILELEKYIQDTGQIKPLMRAAHSIKGAARVIGLDIVVRLAHALEDYFVALQANPKILRSDFIDTLLRAIDWLVDLSKVPPQKMINWIGRESKAADNLIVHIQEEANISPVPGKEKRFTGQSIKKLKKADVNIPAPLSKKMEQKHPEEAPKAFKKLSERQIKVEDKKRAKGKELGERVLRVTAQNLNRLMGLAGEAIVESRWLQPFSDSLALLKKHFSDLINHVDLLRTSLSTYSLNTQTLFFMDELQKRASDSRQYLTDRISDLELFSRRFYSLSDRLYREVLESRMRPFADGVEPFPRMVRDLGRELGKNVRLEIVGKATPVDREILERLEAPLNHLLRNAIDHGIETPEERSAAGKPPEGTIRLEASHKAGMLAITVSDDGRGIDRTKLTEKILNKGLITSEMAASLSDSELVDFLFLPGFSTAAMVTEISGRGVGLNVVQTMIQDVGGSIHVNFAPGKGMTFDLQLPLTLSVIRALIFEISGEPYALPLAHIEKLLEISKHEVMLAENREYYFDGEKNIGLVPAYQVLELNDPMAMSDTLSIAVISDRTNTYGLVVDRFLGERELVVQELDPALGKVANISDGALLEDGDPVLVIDVEDTIHSIDNLLSGQRIRKTAFIEATKKRKTILVVDDSITVREIECRLLRNHGYEVETAVNGMDGWNAVRMGHYDLVITDIDMPRMNGIEFVQLIKSDPKFKHTPVMIVSYKEREEDRLAGLEAGANYYLTKSSFHDETLLQVVHDLIGVAHNE